ncbi:hypothetical protein CLH39_14630 [Alcaligenes faecalis]|nr:hypothetical protein CLH39_14630 [Alcaligenes faecalis]
MPIRVTTRGNQQQQQQQQQKKWSDATSPPQPVSTARVERPSILQVSSNALSVNPLVPGQNAMTDLLGLGQSASVELNRAVQGQAFEQSETGR